MDRPTKKILIPAQRRWLQEGASAAVTGKLSPMFELRDLPGRNEQQGQASEPIFTGESLTETVAVFDAVVREYVRRHQSQ